MPSYTRVPALERALRLLDELARAGPQGRPASVLRERLGLSYSALYALLATLQRHGYVEQVHPRGPYRLGPRAAWLGYAASHHREWHRAFEAITQEPWPETLTLEAPDRDTVRVLAQAPAPHPVRVVRPEGTCYPLESSASGRLFLARSRHHPHLEPVRRRAWARIITQDVVELAVPVCPDGVTPEAALVLHIPRYRWDPEHEARWLERLRVAAARVSHRMGAPIYRPYGHRPSAPLGRPQPMSPQAWKAFLQGPWAARLACLRPDGTPHVVPVWYEWRGNAFLVAAWPGSRWATYVRNNPRVALAIDEPWPPMRRVLAWGKARLWAQDEAARALFQRVSQRYLGEPPPLPEPVTGWQAFRIVPYRVRAWQEADFPPEEG